jgi:short-subunit dehydrogenase
LSQGNAEFGHAGFLKHEAAWTAEQKSPDADMINKVVIVCGGSSGIGLQVADDMAGMGAEVHIICRDQKRGSQVTEMLSKKHKTQVKAHYVDLSVVKQVCVCASVSVCNL